MNITMIYVAAGEPSVHRVFPLSQALATEAGVEPITLLVQPAPGRPRGHRQWFCLCIVSGTDFAPFCVLVS